MKYEKVRELALALEDVTEAPHHHMHSFRVKDKIFATVPPERTHVHIFVDEHESRAWADQEPATYEALMWGAKLAGLRVTLASAKAKDVGELLKASYARKVKKVAKAQPARSPRRR